VSTDAVMPTCLTSASLFVESNWWYLSLFLDDQHSVMAEQKTCGHVVQIEWRGWDFCYFNSFLVDLIREAADIAPCLAVVFIAVVKIQLIVNSCSSFDHYALITEVQVLSNSVAGLIPCWRWLLISSHTSRSHAVQTLPCMTWELTIVDINQLTDILRRISLSVGSAGWLKWAPIRACYRLVTSV